MRAMRASPAQLLLLALALIAAAHIMTAAHGDDSVKSIMTHRSMLRITKLKGALGEGTEAEPASRKANARIAQETTTTTGSTGSTGSTTGSTSDPACAALGCEPGGKCEVDSNGTRYCKWDSLCGACPPGATCKTVQNPGSGVLPVPYCACPKGYGLTATGCVKDAPPTVCSDSTTLIVNRTAKDSMSRPYTFRANLNACSSYPPAVVGTVWAVYTVENIDDAPKCSKCKQYAAENCQGTGVDQPPPEFTITEPFYAQYLMGWPVNISGSVWCTQ